ncbi:unnamed protein product [Phytomonas sp. Hart1]|nr:unnamed protein product [Phytomonas sp. Hart1]|eukprot:CCW68505.1 unnamed protein product [Phytomonas sp. isolate Hart1]
MVCPKSARDKTSRRKTSTVQGEVHSSETSSAASHIATIKVVGDLETQPHTSSPPKENPTPPPTSSTKISDQHSPLSLMDPFLHFSSTSKRKRNPRRSATPNSSTIHFTEVQILQSQLLALAYRYARTALTEEMQAMKAPQLAEKIPGTNPNNNAGGKILSSARTKKGERENTSKAGETSEAPAFKPPLSTLSTTHHDGDIFIRLWAQCLYHEENSSNPMKKEERVKKEKEEGEDWIGKRNPSSAAWCRRVFMGLPYGKNPAVGFMKDFLALPKIPNPIQLTYAESIFLKERCRNFNPLVKSFEAMPLYDESRYEQRPVCIMHYL